MAGGIASRNASQGPPIVQNVLNEPDRVGAFRDGGQGRKPPGRHSWEQPIEIFTPVGDLGDHHARESMKTRALTSRPRPW